MKRVVLIVTVLCLFIAVGCKGGSASKTSNLTVTVVDQSKNAIGGAKVEVDSKSGTTDSSGKIVFKSLEEGSYSVDVSKDGYESVSSSVSLSAGKDESIEITLSKKSEVETTELKEFSSLKSYAFTFVTKDKEGKMSTIKEEINDFGKREHLIVINEEGEVEMEYFLVDDKAKLKTGDTWTEFSGKDAQSMGGIFTSLAESFSESARGWYNEAVKYPGGIATFKRIGTESVNGYSTTKYEYTLTGTATGADYEKIVVEYWVINSGPYKDYTTKLAMNYFPKEGAGSASYQYVEFSFTRFGEDLKIELP